MDFYSMLQEKQDMYNKLKQKRGKPFGFIAELWKNARHAADGILDEGEAYEKLSNYYDTMSEDEKSTLRRFFPTVPEALSSATSLT
ncbi:hypothetical protein TELCIR_18887, partial [Teladorsagia circumcincta]